MADSESTHKCSLSANDEIFNDLNSCFYKLNKQQDKDLRQKFLDLFLSSCNPNDLMYLSSRIDERKCDFLSVLPIELVEIILNKLDWKDLLNCCQVNKNWNEKISNNFNRLWHRHCILRLPFEQNGDFAYDEELNLNYKKVFVEQVKRSNLLESGRMFSKWQITPIEINAIAAYKNIIATATHVIRFWHLVDSIVAEKETNKESENEPRKEKRWESFKYFQLQSRASSMKFDDNYLAVNTYFLSLDLYSLKTNQFIISYMGHTCAISCFDFNSYLKLLVTGSADNTIKFWSMDVDKEKMMWNNSMNQSAQFLIGNESKTIWPMRVSIQPFSSENTFIVIALCTNGFIYVTDVEKIYDDIRDENNEDDDLNCFTFNFKLKISTKLRDFLDAQNMDDDIYELSNLYKHDKLDCTLSEEKEGGEEEDSDTEYDIDEFRLNENNTEDIQELNMGYLMSNKSFIDYHNGTLTAYIVTDNNNYQSTKLFIKRWSLKLFKRYKNSSKLKLIKKSKRRKRRRSNESNSEEYKLDIDRDLDDPNFQAYTYRFKQIPFNNHLFDYLNKRTIDLTEKANVQFEIISFGLSYCLFVDEKNNLYLSNLKNQTVKCLNLELDLDNETEKMFRLITSNTQEQFIYGNRSWFNGFKLNSIDSNKNAAKDNDDSSFVFAFYTQQRQEVIVITWSNFY